MVGFAIGWFIASLRLRGSGRYQVLDVAEGSYRQAVGNANLKLNRWELSAQEIREVRAILIRISHMWLRRNENNSRNLLRRHPITPAAGATGCHRAAVAAGFLGG